MQAEGRDDAYEPYNKQRQQKTMSYLNYYSDGVAGLHLIISINTLYGTTATCLT